MAKRKKYRYRCPGCGLLVWENRLINRYPLELVDVYSSGKGKITNVFLSWDTKNSLHSIFQRHFYDVLRYLLENRYIDAKVVKELACLFDIDYLSPRKPRHVHAPVHIHHPVHVHEPIRM